MNEVLHSNLDEIEDLEDPEELKRQISELRKELSRVRLENATLRARIFETSDNDESLDEEDP